MSLQHFRFRAMAAENELQLHAPADRAREVAEQVIAEVARIEDKYSRYRDTSLLSRINAAAGREAVPVDAETQALLAYAHECWCASGGLFDPTSGVLRRAWRFDVARVPTAAELAALLPLVGWSRVEHGAGSVRLPQPGMEIDFGGFGKEYAVDRAAAILLASGIAGALVNLAGDLAILGSQPGGLPWQVGIRHPRREGAILATLPVHSGAIATSGDYERYVLVDGERHCHLLDPRTGRSVRGFQSVTVHAQSCLVAGSATTIAMLKGQPDGLAWLDDLGLPYFAVLQDGTTRQRWEGRPGIQA